MEAIKRTLKRIAYSAGFQIIRSHSAPFGAHKFADIVKLCSDDPTPVIFDIGANVGQSVLAFKDLFPRSVIHSFEPSPSAFQEMRKVAGRFENVHPRNIALGEEAGELNLMENSSSVMNSFLDQDQDC